MPRIRSRAAIAAASSILLIGCAVAGLAVSPSAPGRWSVQAAPRVSGVLDGVTSLSARDAWAVGYTVSSNTLGPYMPLIERWNGSRWTLVASAHPMPPGGGLNSVAATSARAAWAVGSIGNAVLIERWNGRSWRRVASTVHGVLYSVVAAWARNVWAVGQYGNGRALILHWNGSRWRRATAPSPLASALYSIAVASGSDAWAVGYTGPNVYSGSYLIEHWNGTTWIHVRGPHLPVVTALDAVAASSGRNAWAVGTASNRKILALHWNGTSWHRVPSPCATICLLGSVAVTSRRDAWAVGEVVNKAILILHWNGTAWNRVRSPNPQGAGPDALIRVTASAATRTWAVGRIGLQTSPTALIERWQP